MGPHQISGGPPWLDTDRYEIVAKAGRPAGDARVITMDRFAEVLSRQLDLPVVNRTDWMT